MAESTRTAPSVTPGKTSLFSFRDWLPLVNGSTLRSDLFAALTLAVVVLPQGVAYAIVAGLPPEYGLYTAIVPVIIAAAFGSSRHIVCGPTTPLALMVFATVAPLATPGTADYITLTITLTLLTGLYQLVFALARMGALVNFISHSVIVGFTTGAAVLIITSQIKNALGLHIPGGLSFVDVWYHLGAHLGNIHVYSLVVTAVTLVTAVLLDRYVPRWPGLLIAMIVGSLVAALPGGRESGIALLGSLPDEFPSLSIPNITYENVRSLLSGAFAVALVGLVEAVTIARGIAARTRQHHNANQEFLGQSLSNIAGSFFHSFPSTASFIRSFANHQSGARTPLAAIFCGLLVAIILVLVAPLAGYLPLPAMAGILLLTAYRLIDFQHIRMIFRASREETAVFLATSLLVVLVALDFGIYVGVILSLLLHLNRISHPRIQSRVPDTRDDNRRFVNTDKHAECPQLKIIRVDGSFFFGSVTHVEDYLRSMQRAAPDQHNLLIICNSVNFIDIGGAEFLAQEAERRRAMGGDLFLCGVKKGVYNFLKRSGHLDIIGEDHIFHSKREAIKTIFPQLDHERCIVCTARVFDECQSVPVATENRTPVETKP
jgi:SulP family sulfate permease